MYTHLTKKFQVLPFQRAIRSAAVFPPASEKKPPTYTYTSLPERTMAKTAF
jgi:hypothetical protein